MSIADVEDPVSVSRAVDEAADIGGGALQGLCYAVGTINLKPFARLAGADFERDFTVNALGAARAVQAALPALKAALGTTSVLLFSTVAVKAGLHRSRVHLDGERRGGGTHPRTGC